jgi:hypothetical protein
MAPAQVPSARRSVVHPSNAGGFLNDLPRSGPGLLVRRSVRGQSTGGRDYTRTTYRTNNGEILLEDWIIHNSGLVGR